MVFDSLRERDASWTPLRFMDYVPPVSTTLQASGVIDTIRERATKRGLERLMRETVEMLAEPGLAVADAVQRHLQRLAETAPPVRKESWSDCLAAAHNRIDQATNRDRVDEERQDEVPFGFSDLDSMLQPMRLGQMVVLAARPSLGKSSLARQLAWHNAVERGRPVLFASLEVLGEELALGWAQTMSGVSFRSLTPDTPPEQRVAVERSLRLLREAPLEVLTGHQVNLAALRAKAEIMRARGTPYQLVVVDYLQLMPDTAPTKGEPRAISVGRVSTSLKQFALDFKCAVLVLSQLNRDSVRDQREPALYDLRESGAIEQDADKVILLHRPPECPLTGKAQPETEGVATLPRFYVRVIQAKGRSDGSGATGLLFHRAITRFETPTTSTPSGPQGRTSAPGQGKGRQQRS